MTMFPAINHQLLNFVVVASLTCSLRAAETKSSTPPRDHSPQNVVVFSSTHEVSGFARPTKDKPAYYLAMAGGYHAEGPQIAGDNADKVGPDEVWKPLEKVLALQGYLRVTKTTPPPSLLLVFHWGTMSPDFVGGGTSTDPDQPPQNARLMNEKQMGELVGATRVDRHLESEFGQTYRNATEQRYIVIVTAYDYAKATAPKREKKVVWRTRLSVPLAGTTLPDAIMPMIVSGAPYFGRDSGQPKEIRWDGTKVEIGETKVVDAPAPAASTPAVPEKK